MAQSIAILDTFQVKFLHRKEVVAKKLICTHLYTQKTCPKSIGWYREVNREVSHEVNCIVSCELIRKLSGEVSCEVNCKVKCDSM